MPGLSITDLLNVRTLEEYGGDPTGNKGNYAALTAMLHDLSADGGGEGHIGPGTWLVEQTVGIPSNCKLIGAGMGRTTIKRLAGMQLPVFVSATYNVGIAPGTGDTDIEIADMTIDGTNTTPQNGSQTIWLTGTLRPVCRNLRLINGTNSDLDLQGCKSGICANIRCETAAGLLTMGGLHLWDSSDFVVSNVTGNTGDDLFAITAGSYNVNGITVMGVTGQSAKSRVVNLECQAGVTLSGINISGIVAQNSFGASVSLDPVSGGTIQDCSIDLVTVTSNARALYLTAAGTIQRCRFRIVAQGPVGATAEFVLADTPTIQDLILELLMNNASDGANAVKLVNPNRCTVTVKGDYQNSGKVSPQAVINLSGTGTQNQVINCNVKGGAWGVNLAGTITGTQIRGNTFDSVSPNPVVNEQGSSTGNVIAENVFVGPPTTPVVLAGGSTTIVTHNVGLTTENGGTSNFTGNGSATSFTIAHGLPTTPAKWFAQPTSALGSGITYVVAAGASNLTVTFSAAPAAGTYPFVWGATYAARA